MTDLGTVQVNSNNNNKASSSSSGSSGKVSPRAYTDRSDLGGLGQFASTDVKAGDVIFRLDRPLVAVPDTPRLSETCSNCFSWEPGSDVNNGGDGGVKLRACTGCKVVKYCGKRCQVESWKACHKFECKVYASLHPQILPNTVRLLARLVLTGCIDLRDSEGHNNDLRYLESHVDDFKKSAGDTWENLCLMAKMVKKVTGTAADDEDLLIELLAKVLTNSMNVVTPCYDPLGTCLDPVVARMNHACEFNAIVSFDGPVLFVRSLRDIKKGEEITISYVDATNPLAMRQAQLKDRWFFACQCRLCRRGTDTPLDAFLPGSRDMRKARDLEAAGFGTLDIVAREGRSPEDHVRELEAAMGFIHSTYAFPLYRQPYAALRQQLIGAYLSTQQWVKALAHAVKQHLYVDPHLFPQEFHPIRVVHTWVLIMLLNHVRHETHEATMKALGKYNNILWDAVMLTLTKDVVQASGRSHGEDTQFARMVQSRLTEMTGGMEDVSVRPDVVEDQWKKLRALASDLAQF